MNEKSLEERLAALEGVSNHKPSTQTDESLEARLQSLKGDVAEEDDLQRRFAALNSGATSNTYIPGIAKKASPGSCGPDSLLQELAEEIAIDQAGIEQGIAVPAGKPRSVEADISSRLEKLEGCSAPKQARVATESKTQQPAPSNPGLSTNSSTGAQLTAKLAGNSSGKPANTAMGSCFVAQLRCSFFTQAIFC